MNNDNILRVVEANLCTTENMVTEAKIFLTECRESSTQNLLNSLMDSRGVAIPQHLNLMGKTEQEAGQELAKAISWRNAGARALWVLQGQGLCIPTNNELPDNRYSIQFTSGSSNYSTKGNLNLGGLLLQAVRAVKWISEEDINLSNSDVYLNNVETNSLSNGVGTDLKQSVECFRRELYLPSIVMLGRAVEGGWIHVGESIALAIEDQSVSESLLSQINDPYLGITGKVNFITDEYKKKINFGKLQHHSKVTPKILSATKQWSEQILEYRNAIHPKAEQAIRYNYENVSVLLLSVRSHFKILDSLVEHANRLHLAKQH